MSLFGSSSLFSSMLDPRIFGAYSAYYDEYLAELATQAEQVTNTDDTNDNTENPNPTTITTDDFLLQEENEEIIKDYLNIPEGSVLVNDLLTIQNGYITIDASLIPTGDLVVALPTGEDLQIINEDTTTIITYDENNTTITIEYNGYTYSIATQYITEEQITEVQTHTISDPNTETITTASLRTLGHANFDYHNYQLDNNYLDIRLKYNFYFVDSNGVPTDDTNATKVYYTGMYQLNPNSGYNQYQHTIIDKNDTNIRTIKIPDNTTLRVHLIEGDGNVYVNNTAVQNPNINVSVSNNDILKIEYSHSENGNVVVSDTIEFKVQSSYTEYIPRDLIQTNNNGNVITRSTQPIWYVRNNVIIINLEKLVGHTYMFNNPDSHLGYVPVFPHNYKPYNNGFFPEIAIPYSSGMKVKWLGLTNAITPNSSNSGEATIYRAQYYQETTGMFNVVIPAAWGHGGHYITAGTEYDIPDGDPDGGDTYAEAYIRMENNQDALYRTAINVYFHKIPEPPVISSATEQFYDISTHKIELRPWELVNNQVRFRYNSATSNHYVDKGGSYYVYIPDNIDQIYLNNNYPNNDSLQFRNKSKNNVRMFGSKFRSSSHWDIGDTIEVYTWTSVQGQPEPTEIVFNLILTDDYSLGWQGAGLPAPPVYPENGIGIHGFQGDTDRTYTSISSNDATTITFMDSLGGNVVLTRGSNYYLYIPSEINEIKSNYSYWIRNQTKNSWWNSGTQNQSAGGINTRGSKWSIGDRIAFDKNSALSNPVYLTITDVAPP